MNREKRFIVMALIWIGIFSLSACSINRTEIAFSSEPAIYTTDSESPINTASSANQTEGPKITVPTGKPRSTVPPDATLGNNILALSIGNDKEELCFRKNVENVAWGPKDFVVYSGELYVLNSAGGNVLRFGMDGHLVGEVHICDPDPGLGYYPHKFCVGLERLYVVDYNYGEVCVFEKESGVFITSCKLPIERVTFNGDSDPLDFWYGNNFSGSIIQMYEVGSNIIFVVHDTYYTITTYLFDVDAGTIIPTKEYGLSGDMYGKLIALHNNETGAKISFRLDGWTMDRILGFDSVGSVYVSAFLETDYQPCPRKVFAVGSDGSIVAESATVEDSGFIGFSLGNDSIVYAMIRDGDHVNLVRVNLY